jgi:hypothetical protein
MRRLLVRSLVVVALAVMASGTFLFAQGFNARTGAWTFTVTMKGAMPMDGLPPEARAALEAQLSKPQTMNSCVTAEDLKQLKLGNPDDGNDEDCKIVSSKITATMADVTRECKGDDPSTETLHFEAPTPQTLTGSVIRKTAKGAMTISMAGKWVAAQCKD